MAKKKKENKITEVVQNTASSRGNVKITMFRKDKKFKTINTHNTGTIYLCEYLRDALIGENINARRPGKIKLCKKDTSGKLVEIYNYPITYTSGWKNKFTIEDTSCSASISFLIPSSILTEGMTIQGFKLFSLRDDEEKEYAELDLTTVEDPETHEVSDQSIVVTGDTNLEIEWTLKISFI